MNPPQAAASGPVKKSATTSELHNCGATRQVPGAAGHGASKCVRTHILPTTRQVGA